MSSTRADAGSAPAPGLAAGFRQQLQPALYSSGAARLFAHLAHRFVNGGLKLRGGHVAHTVPERLNAAVGVVREPALAPQLCQERLGTPWLDPTSTLTK